MTEEPDRVLWLCQIREELGVTGETVRRWRKEGRLPKPDVQLTLRSVGWRLSTLRAAGINLPPSRSNPRTPAALPAEAP